MNISTLMRFLFYYYHAIYRIDLSVSFHNQKQRILNKFIQMTNLRLHGKEKHISCSVKGSEFQREIHNYDGRGRPCRADQISELELRTRSESPLLEFHTFRWAPLDSFRTHVFPVRGQHRPVRLDLDTDAYEKSGLVLPHRN